MNTLSILESPEGARIAGVFGRFEWQSEIWDLESGARLTERPNPPSVRGGLLPLPDSGAPRLSPDGWLLAEVSLKSHEAKSIYKLDFIETSTGKRTEVVPSFGLAHVAFSSDGKQIATAGEDISVRDIKTLKVVWHAKVADSCSSRPSKRNDAARSNGMMPPTITR